MDDQTFRKMSKTLDNIEEVICGDPMHPKEKPGLMRIVMKHDAIIYGEDGGKGLLMEWRDWQEKRANVAGVVRFCAIIGVAVVSTAAGVEILSKIAEWVSKLQS